MGLLSLYSVLCLHLFLYHSLSSCFAFPPCRIDQSSALLDFKNSFSIIKPDPSDDFNLFCDFFYVSVPYPKTSSWENGTNCCKWDGVTCNALVYIIDLDLVCSWLHGKLLPNNSLFKLTHLQRLDLSVNDFQRSHISPNFAQLVSLTQLHLLFSNFSGEVPSHISHLQKLVSLDLSYNVDHFAFINDQYYYCLSLKPNTWERLVQNLTNIMELHLSAIDMSLIPPSQLLNLSTSLVSLWLEGTTLQGNLEDNIFCFPHLEEIYLSRNINLTGYLPKSNGSNSLRVLSLYDTSFTGELPHSIGHMKLLNKLDISSCQFVGEIPPSLWNLTQLATLDLSDNNFSGQISSSLSNLQNLTFLGLSSNNFDGHLPDEISGFSNLWGMDLSHNLLNGTIPCWCFSLPSLEYLDVSSNQFTSQIGEISSYLLEWLDVSNNRLYSSIPRSIFYLQNLKLLNLSHNSLTGVVQLHHLSWTEMYSIDLSSNLLQGELTSSICNASSLEILNLSHNKFTGNIPQCIGSSSLALSVLDLQNNSFFGTMPETFEVGNNLRTLNLNGNLLEGLLPQSLVNCTRLKVLDLGRNGIKDTFPHWLQVLEELQVLVLRENKLHGPIPHFNNKANTTFPKLRVFDLSRNNLSGPLPAAYFKSFEAMKDINGEIGLKYMSYENRSSSLYQNSIEVTVKGLDIHPEKILTIFTTIDLSNNTFEGKIPKVIGELGALRGLNFSHNRLTGAIPSSIGNLKNLEWLDLSSNMFTGNIPAKLTDLNFLSVVNLSQNQLEGCIPKSQQFGTFTGDSFIGNKGLRGFPLSIPCVTHEKSEPPLPSSSFEVGFEFGWKPVLLGYLSGSTFGATMFWFVTFNQKPRWIASMVNDLSYKRKRRVRNCPT